jgi:nucleoside-diphosphate-sugar epimerase
MRLALLRPEGLIGQAIAARAVADGHQVVALLGRNAPRTIQERLRTLGPGLQLQPEEQNRRSAFRGCQVLIDASSRAPELGPDSAFRRADATQAEGLLNDARAAGVSRVVLVSSLAVHRFDGSINAQIRGRPRDRDDLTYARSLRYLEEMVLGCNDIEGVVVRPGLWPVGVGDPLLWRLVRALRRGLLPLVGAGAGVLNLIDTDELAHGLLLAAESPRAAGRLYAMAHPEPLRWRDALTTLASLVGGPPPRQLLPSAPLQTAASVLERAYGIALPNSEASLTRFRIALLGSGLHVAVDDAERELGWRSTTPWRESLRRLAVDALRTGEIHPRGRT